MLNNRFFIIIVIVIGLLVGAIGCVIIAVRNNDKAPDETITDVSSGTSDDPNHDDRFEHIVGEPVIEFDDGSEVYFDESLTAYLNRMEFGAPATDADGNYYFDKDGDIVYDLSEEKNLEWVLDNLITLINHFAKEQYSMDASHQIQRFYVIYYDRLTDLNFEDLVAKLKVCFPSEGANAETLGETVLNTFGIGSSDDCAFVFKPIQVAEIKVEFYNVALEDVVLAEEAEALCIYENWRNEEDDGYERNLEGWLHNVISVAQSNGFDEEKTMVAEILYAGSLANAEYRSDWKDALVRCLSVEEWNYESLKPVVEMEFGVTLDHNVPIQEYFDTIGNGGNE